MTKVKVRELPEFPRHVLVDRRPMFDVKLRVLGETGYSSVAARVPGTADTSPDIISYHGKLFVPDRKGVGGYREARMWPLLEELDE